MVECGGGGGLTWQGGAMVCALCVGADEMSRWSWQRVCGELRVEVDVGVEEVVGIRACRREWRCRWRWLGWWRCAVVVVKGEIKSGAR